MPVIARNVALLYGLGNLIENAVQFASVEVTIKAVWDGRRVTIVITDDGPGFPPDLLSRLGEPYLTTRARDRDDPRQPEGAGGLGLGVFIAKTLLERTGATLVHAFEDERVIAGQGTIGLELAGQAPEAQTVLIPVGGGGLAAGISLALRDRVPGQRIVGVVCRPGLTIADGISVKSRGELAG